MFEEHDCSPVIREVLGKGARGARALFSNVPSHVCFERIATNVLCKWADGITPG